jgi:hypothetical protein
MAVAVGSGFTTATSAPIGRRRWLAAMAGAVLRLGIQP